jgi:hypothetical protein
MRRTAAMLLFLLFAMKPALTGERGPVCRETSVVDEITREVRAVDYYGEVDPRAVGQQPTTDPRFVRCHVCVQSVQFDTMRFGDRPIAQCISRGFEVQILPDGFVVRALP